jgi:hypothetical protein
MVDLRIGYALVTAWLATWARLVFMWPTHRIIRLAPGAYIQVPRGMSDAAVAAALAAYIQKGKA